MAYEFALPKDAVLRHKPLMGRESTYTIEKVLGQGGFGITYLAYSSITILNTEHKLYFAIKEFFVKGQCWREEGSYDMKYSPAAREEVEYCKKDFIDEAKRLYKICSTNTNIVKVNEVFEINSTAYYVMEYLNGGSVRDRIVASKSPFDVKDALDLFIPIAKAVDLLHNEFKLLHCDISPDNIILRKGDNDNEIPVLIDFGESHHFNSKGELTTTHNAIGAKEGYAPPEQYRGITVFDPRIDVYALTATLFYMLTARKPISAFDISNDYIEKYLPEGLAENIRMAILHGMQRDKENRTDNVANLINELSTLHETIDDENILEQLEGETADAPSHGGIPESEPKNEGKTIKFKKPTTEKPKEEPKTPVITTDDDNINVAGGKTIKINTGDSPRLDTPQKPIKPETKPEENPDAPQASPRRHFGKIVAILVVIAGLAYAITYYSSKQSEEQFFTSPEKPSTEQPSDSTESQSTQLGETNTQNKSETTAKEAEAKQKADADEAAAKKKAEEAAAKKKSEEAAAAARRKAEQDAAAAAKRQADQAAAAAAARRKAEQDAAAKKAAEEAAALKKLREKNSGWDEEEW